MGQMRCIFLIFTLFIGVLTTSYAQYGKDKQPPAPTAKVQESPPCDPGPGDGTGGPSPPPGLCLPIDDYVYILMAVGVMYGCYKARDFEVS